MNTRVAVSLRPMLPADAPALAAIFRASIEALAGEDYSPAQQEAWMSVADDEEAFAARLAGDLTLVAIVNREPVGFASLRDNAHIEMLYVRPDHAGQGVAKALCEAQEMLAAARGTTALTVDASDNALGFFAHRGYASTRRNTVELNGEWLANTSMQKALAPVAKGALQ